MTNDTSAEDGNGRTGLFELPLRIGARVAATPNLSVLRQVYGEAVSMANLSPPMGTYTGTPLLQVPYVSAFMAVLSVLSTDTLIGLVGQEGAGGTGAGAACEWSKSSKQMSKGLPQRQAHGEETKTAWGNDIAHGGEDAIAAAHGAGKSIPHPLRSAMIQYVIEGRLRDAFRFDPDITCPQATLLLKTASAGSAGNEAMRLMLQCVDTVFFDASNMKFGSNPFACMGGGGKKDVLKKKKRTLGDIRQQLYVLSP